MATSAAKCLATESYSKLLSSKTRPLRAMEMTPTSVTMDEDCIRNTVSVDRDTVASKAKITPTKDNRTHGDAEGEEMHKGGHAIGRGNAINVRENTLWMA